MHFPSDELKNRLDVMEKSIRPVMKMLTEMQSGDLGIKTKSNELDLVTLADVKSEGMILEILKEHFPGDGVIAEESGKSGSGDFQWLIDPVDGTINYAHGLPLYAISLGILYKGEQAAGLIALPALGDIYRAVKGKGAYKNGSPIQVSKVSQLNQALVVTGFPYDRHDILDTLVLGVRQALEHCRGLRRTGSAALDLCWVAEGKFALHFENSLQPWDFCAGTLLLREAGGRVSGYDGKEHTMSSKTIIASNGILHEAFLEILAPMREKFSNPVT